MIETVAYLGPQGTFTHEAALTLFPEPTVELVAYSSIPDVLTAVNRGISDIAVVPVENAIEGSVNSTLDWLVHHVDVPILGELVYPIRHCLLAHPAQAGRHKQEFTRILSHPQAIAQCQLHLRKEFSQAELFYTDSTAQAAKMIASHPHEPWLAIGTERAGKFNQLHLLQKEIQDHPNNFTRFIAVGKQKKVWHTTPSLFKTSLQITLPSDYPGALYQVLAAFSWRKINLCHIESRPTKTGLGNYFFLIDTELPEDHVLMQGAIAEIEALGCQVRLLGSYPCYHKNSIRSLT